MYKTATIHDGTSENGQKQIDLQFKQMDTDNDGLIKWWQFLNHEAKLALAKRSTVSNLYHILTE